MSRRLFDHLDDIGRRVASASGLLLLLDYDGTLAELVSTPGGARIAPETRELVARIAVQPNTWVAILSGRSLEDVRERVGIPGLIYSGNHGLEIHGPGLQFVEPEAASLQPRLSELAATLRETFQNVAGVLVQDKGLTLSVHFRRAAPADLASISQTVAKLVPSANPHFRVHPGNQVWEVRPKVNWHKGAAAKWIRGRLGPSSMLPVCIGDDVTDEDAFQAVSDGVTVRVANPQDTSAHYHLADPAAVHEFLTWLADRLGSGPGLAFPAPADRAAR